MATNESQFDSELDFEELGSEQIDEIEQPLGVNQSRVRRRREVKRKLENLKEQKWFKRENWFDDDHFFDFEETA